MLSSCSEPSVQLEPATGHWIEFGGTLEAGAAVSSKVRCRLGALLAAGSGPAALLVSA